MNDTPRTPAEQEDWKRKLERRGQSVVLSVITAAILWSATTLVELKTTAARNADHLENMDVQLSGAYRATDAKRDMAELKGGLDATNATNVQQQILIELSVKRISLLEEQHKIEWARSHPYQPSTQRNSGALKQPNG